MRIVTHTLESLVAEATEWHRQTFGAQSLIGPMREKFKEEAEEYYEDPSEGEAADVLLCLCVAAGREEWDLIAAARAKLAKVKARNQIARDKERGILPAGWEPAPAEGEAA